MARFKLKKAEVEEPAVEVPTPIEQKVETNPVAQAQKEPEKEVTIEEVLMNHENRMIQMEAKWFRLGGI